MSPARTLLCFLLLATPYLLYGPHAEFVSDDWFQLDSYRSYQARGWTGQWELVQVLVQNKLYGQFQLNWLVTVMDSLILWIVGYAPRFVFALAVAVHLVNAWLFYRLLTRLEVAGSVAFASGAVFLLVPTAHNVLFWALNTGFFRVPPLFLMLLWLSFVKALHTGLVGWKTALWQAALVVATLFSGGAPLFLLLLFGGPWIALCWFRREQWRLAARLTLAHWALVTAALAVYLRFGTAVPLAAGARYDFSYGFFVWNTRNFRGHLFGLSGLAGASFEVRPEVAVLAAAILAALLVVVGVGRARDGQRWRPAMFAAGLLALAGGPLLFLVGRTLRHYYTVSPFLALLVAALLPARRFTAAAVCAWFAAGTVAEIRQCWIPQSRHVQALKAGLRSLRNLEPGDLVVVPGAPWVTGTAQNFVLTHNLWADRFARIIVGVPDLEFWREIVIEQGMIRLYHRHTMRTTSAEELARAHVLIGPPEGPYHPALSWAEPIPDGSRKLHCLKDDPCTSPSGRAVPAASVYVAKPFDPHHPEHRVY